MMKQIINQTNYDWQAPQVTDHMKCGEVFTWMCAGELYAVECKLCEDCPLCPLSEFPQHMDIWHTEWQIATVNHEDNNGQEHFTDDDDDDDYNDDEAQQQNALNNNYDCDRGLEPAHALQDDRVTSQQQTKEVIEPFEQVLIEQEVGIQPTHTNENIYEEEYVEDVNLPAADNKQFVIENKQKLTVNTNPILQLLRNEQRTATNEVTESERAWQYLIGIRENETKDLSNEQKTFKFHNKSKDSKRNAGQKCRNYTKSCRNFNNKIQAASDSGSNSDSDSHNDGHSVSGSETYATQNLKSRNIFNKSGEITKSIQQNLTKIEKIKTTLNKIVKNINNLKASVETESETTGNETTNIKNKKNYLKAAKLRTFKTKFSNKRKNILRNVRKFKRETIENEINTKDIVKRTRGKETGLIAYETSQIAGKNIATDSDTSEKDQKIFQPLNRINRFKSLYTETLKTPKNFKIYNKNNARRIQNSVKSKTNRNCAKKLRKITKNCIKTYKTKSDYEAGKTEITGIETENHMVANFKESKRKLNENASELIKTDLMPSYTGGMKQRYNKMELIESETEPNEMAIEGHEKGKQTKIYNKLQNKDNECGSCSAIKTILTTAKAETHENETLQNHMGAQLNEQKNFASGSSENNYAHLKFNETKRSAEKNLEKSAKFCLELQQDKMKMNAKETNEYETQNPTFLDCLQKSAEIKGKKESKRDTNENGTSEIEKHENFECLQNSLEVRQEANKISKMPSNENETYEKLPMIEMENMEHDKTSICYDVQDSRKPGKSWESFTKNFTYSPNFKHSNKKELQVQGTNENEATKYIKRRSVTNGRERKRKEIRQRDGGKLIKIETKNFAGLKNILHKSSNLKALNSNKRLSDSNRENEFKRKVSHYENEREDSSKRLKTCYSTRIKKRKKIHWKRCAFKRPLKVKFYYLKNHFENSKGTRRRSTEEEEYSSELNVSLANESEMKTLCYEGKNRDSLIFKEKVNGVVGQEERKPLPSLSPKEDNGKGRKQTLATQFFSSFSGNSEKVQLKFQEPQTGTATKVEGASETLYKLDYNISSQSFLERVPRNSNHQMSSSGKGIQLFKNSENSEEHDPNLQKRSAKNPGNSEKSEHNLTSDQLNLHESFSGKFTQHKGTSRNSEYYENHQHIDTFDGKGNGPTVTSLGAEIPKSSEYSQKHVVPSDQFNLWGCCSRPDSLRNLNTQQEAVSRTSENSYKLEHSATYDQLNLQESSSGKDRQHEEAAKSSDKSEKREHNPNSDQFNFRESSSDKSSYTTLNLPQEGASQQTCTSYQQHDLQQFFSVNITQHKGPSSNCQKLESFCSKANCATPGIKPSSPLSPKTEEEHFEFYEPKEKLNEKHIRHLIKLYREHPRLWDQTHSEFCEPPECRKSWHTITQQWNEFCQRKFTIAEVRIRICTLCQRFLQQRDRLASEGEVDESVKFPYYEEMQFLEQHKSLQRRRELYDQQNDKILEIYQHFPALWHVGFYKLTKPAEREQAIESISKALRLFDINLSCMAIRKRLRSLRKCYRLEKIRHLHAQVEETAFESKFQHYERMHFLDKHIEPFACRVCGKIFENLPAYRQHLAAEGHGSVGMEDPAVVVNAELGFNEESCEALVPENSFENGFETEAFAISPTDNDMQHFSESEDSRDILQRFTPFSSSPVPSGSMIATPAHLQGSETPSSPIQEVVYFPLDTTSESIIDSLHFEEQLIEEIMENVPDSVILSQQGLDQFINGAGRCDEASLNFDLTVKNCSPSLVHAENSFIVEHPDIVADQSASILSLSPMAESFTPLQFYNENSFIIEHPDIVAEQNVCFLNEETNVETVGAALLHGDGSAAVQHSEAIPLAIDKALEVSSPYLSDQETCSFNDLEDQIAKLCSTENTSPTAPLMVKMQCPGFSIDVKLNSSTTETLDAGSLNEFDTNLMSTADTSTIPLPDHLIHKMIEVYRKYPQLWNPNHLDFNSRTLRREAWCSLTAEFNAAMGGKPISWRTLHRKLTDYAKYYKKLITEQEDYARVVNKWAFYEDFKFLDDVIDVNNELQRSIHHRDSNFKIIDIYRTLPQLWNTQNPDYNKRGNKQRNIEIMCNKLQEEKNLQLTTERVKSRLIELRTQYRTAKKQRLKCLKNKQTFSTNQFEYYEALNFLDDHIDPFICVTCNMEFQKRTAYKQHLKKEHTQKSASKTSLTILPPEADVENICHICGIKFTTRSNLRHHLRRHEGIRNYACTLCPMKFYASYALKVHIRSHTKECPYTCDKCGMSFVSAGKLNQHVKRHFNKKDFQCDFCAKAFFTAVEKDRHERRHLNIRDKSCPVCGKTFVAGSSYYAHLMLHDDTKRFECDKCDMKFAQYAGLYKHKKKHHK